MLDIPDLVRLAHDIEASRLATQEAYEHRLDGDAAADNWRAQTAAFLELHTVFERVASEAVEGMRADQAGSTQWAIEFMEADPRCFRSGYAKERLMQTLSQQTLDERDGTRLRQVVLHHVDVGDRREFRYSCKLARHVRTPALVDELKLRLHGIDSGAARRALWMLSTFRGTRLSPVDVGAARLLLLQAADGPDFHRTRAWVKRLATRFMTRGWAAQLVVMAITADFDQDGALRLLSTVDCYRFTPEQTAEVEQLVLAAVDGLIDGEYWLEHMAAKVATNSLVDALRERQMDPDPDVQKRTRWALRAITATTAAQES